MKQLGHSLRSYTIVDTSLQMVGMMPMVYPYGLLPKHSI
eukprot:SAG11_NODE_41603_length_192_cov_10.655914_1_plen_38_part_01